MKITWHGHACFTLESQDGTVVFDPYEDGSVPGLKPLQLSADLVLCSHQHGDHKVKQTKKITNLKIDTIDCFHDDQNGTLRGHNIIHIVYCENMKVVHLGDLGHKLDHYDLLKNCDVLMIPIGGHYTIDAKTAYDIVNEIKPRVVIPMHYRSNKFGYDVIGTLDDYTQYINNQLIYKDSEIEITKTTPYHTALLKAKESV